LIVSLVVSLWPRILKFRKLLAVPGPLLPRGLKGNLVDYIAEPRKFGPKMAAKHGPLYRVYSNNLTPVLALADPVLAQALYQNHQGTMAKPKDLNQGAFLARFLQDAVGLVNGREWTKLKKAFKVPMSISAANESLANIEVSLDQWEEEVLEPLARSREVLTIPQLVDLMPITVMFNIFFGHAFASRHRKRLVSLTADADSIIKTGLYNKLACNNFYQYLPTEANRTLARFQHQWAEILAEYETSPERLGGEGGTFDSVVEFVKSPGKETITFKEIVNTMSEVIFTNQDVLSPAISWLFADLVIYPHCVEYLQLDGVTEMMDKPMLENDFPQLLNLIQESARVHPFFPLSTPDILTSDVEVAGFSLPKGTILSVDQYAINHNPKYWPQPHQFRPERFETTDDFTNKWALFRFGFGARRCSGQFLGNIVMANVTARFLSRWKLEPIGMEGIVNHEQVPTAPGNFAMMPDIKVRLEKRV